MTNLDQTCLATLCCGMIAGALVQAPANGAEGSTLVWLDAKRLENLSQALGPGGDVVGISRNGDGTRLLCTLRTNRVFSGSQQLLLGILSEHGSEFKLIPRGIAEANEDGRPLCLYSNANFVFPGRTSFVHEPGAFIRFSPDRSLFFISGETSTNRARIFRTIDLEKPLVWVPEGFFPQRIFAATNEIFIFGHKRKPHSQPGEAAPIRRTQVTKDVDEQNAYD